MKNIAEMRLSLQGLWDEFNSIEQAIADEKREATIDETTRREGLMDQIESLGREIVLEERSQRAAGFTLETDDEGDEERGSCDSDDPEERTMANIGEYLQAVAAAAMPRGMGDIGEFRTGVMDPLLIGEARATGSSESVPSGGGFLVGTQMSNGLITKAHDVSLLFPRCRNIPIGPAANGLKMNGVDETSRANGSRWGGVRVYRTNEAAALTGSAPKFSQIQIDLEKMTGLHYATDELLQDATALGAVLLEAFGEEFAFKLDDEILAGTGAGEMLGILNSGALVSVSKESGQDADSLAWANIKKIYARLWGRSRAGAVWLANQDCLPELMGMTMPVGTGGVPVWLPAGGAANSPHDTLLGRPILYPEQCETIGDKGDIYFADLGQYLTIDKGGIQSAQSIHVQFVAAETCFRFIYRNNGRPLWDSAMTPYKGGSTKTVSPFIALNERA